MTQALAKAEKEQSISAEDIDLIKKTVAAGATDPEFRLFLYIAQRYNLDPLVKQIWLIKYGNSPAAIFTSRDGFLSIAHRSGQFDGMETTAVRDDKNKVIGAICRVWRKDMTHPFMVEVGRQEYDTNKGNWQKMPETMIKKVAESQCLRRAFDISGLYDPSEYDPAENNQAVQQVEAVTAQNDAPVTTRPAQTQETSTTGTKPAQPQQAPKPAQTVTQMAPTPAPAGGLLASEQQVSAIIKLAGRKGMDEIERDDQIKKLYGCRLNELSQTDASHFIRVLQEV